MAKNKKTENQKSPYTYFIPAGTLIGLGLGMLYGNTGAGVLIGIGCGFAAWGIIEFIKK